MELLQLRYFLAAARYEHITQAAAALNIAQPALTQSIRRLENELGMPLFDREGRSVRLNASGQLLRDQLIPVLGALDAIPQLLNDDLVSRGKVIHLNVQAASSVVTEHIIRFKEQHPDVDFHLVHDSRETDADVSITTSIMTAPAELGDTVFLEQIFLAVPASGRFAGRSSIRLEEVADEGFICLSSSWKLRAICDQFCMRAGFIPHVAFESDNPDAVRNLIGANLGVGFWPAYSWDAINTPNISLIPVENPDCRRSLIVRLNPRTRRDTPAAEFCTTLIEKIAHLGSEKKPSDP